MPSKKVSDVMLQMQNLQSAHKFLVFALATVSLSEGDTPESWINDLD